MAQFSFNKYKTFTIPIKNNNEYGKYEDYLSTFVEAFNHADICDIRLEVENSNEGYPDALRLQINMDSGGQKPDIERQIKIAEAFIRLAAVQSIDPQFRYTVMCERDGKNICIAKDLPNITQADNVKSVYEQESRSEVVCKIIREEHTNGCG